MASSDQNALPAGALDELAGRVGSLVHGEGDGRGTRVGIACARFNGDVTWRLLQGALDGLEEGGVQRSDITVVWVPGSFELPLAAHALTTGREARDVVICLGAVVRGETDHYDHVAGQCAAGIQRVQLDTGVPVVFGVLTTEDMDQAYARAKLDDSNKGREAALAGLQMVRVLRALR